MGRTEGSYEVPSMSKFRALPGERLRFVRKRLLARVFHYERLSESYAMLGAFRALPHMQTILDTVPQIVSPSGRPLSPTKTYAKEVPGVGRCADVSGPWNQAKDNERLRRGSPSTTQGQCSTEARADGPAESGRLSRLVDLGLDRLQEQLCRERLAQYSLDVGCLLNRF